MVRIAIFYYSQTGNTLAAARLVEQGVKQAGDIETRLVDIMQPEAHEYLRQADAVIFGTPTYSASFAWPLKRWYDEEARTFGLAGKLAANFATGMHIGGGQDTALKSMAAHEIMRGMLVYSGGGPLTHLGAVILDMEDAAQRERAILFGERIGRKTLELFCPAQAERS